MSGSKKTKKKSSRAKKKEDKFEVRNLSLGELVLFFGHDICDGSHKYIKFGKDFKGAWEALKKNRNDYLFIMEYLSLDNSEGDIPPDMLKAVKPFLDTTKISDDSIEDNLREVFEEVLKDNRTDDDLFKEVMEALYEQAERKYKQNCAS